MPRVLRQEQGINRGDQRTPEATRDHTTIIDCKKLAIPT